VIAKVVTDIALDKEFDYLVPDNLGNQIRIGSAVDVPFGHQVRQGFVLDLTNKSYYAQDKLRAIIGISKTRASIPEKLIELGKWMAEYYCCTLEQSIRTLLPAAVRSGKIRKRTRKIISILDRKQIEQIALQDNPGAAKRAWIARELLKHESIPLAALSSALEFSESSLNTLQIKKAIKIVEEEVPDEEIVPSNQVADAPRKPTPDQEKALKQICDMLSGETKEHVLLLHGVTNSGKTEVYLQAISETLARGKSAIVLVPEISLTPQTVRRFKARFGDTLSVLHSQLSDRERFEEWNRINSGKTQIVVGARSALFAPFTNLGLIVVDEEHESSYKQSEAPRYMARDVAVMRGLLEKAVVILGSATPSAETCYNVEIGKFAVARMTCQVQNRPAPRIEIVDQRLAGPPEEGQSNLFSPLLISEVHHRLELGEQTILFFNRRGYARVLRCEEEKCDYEAICPNCSISSPQRLVHYLYSRGRQTLTCHLCGEIHPAPLTCPKCGSPKIRYSGNGTEKIESMARGIFSQARIARMDSDTMKNAEDYVRVLDEFKRGNIDILIGTQMIAKGLHFPNVTLVGILNADQELMMQDFRASERAFQLITQVAGRAGRGEQPGTVILQTYNPENDVIDCAANLDFEGFKEYDLEFRKLLNYPPFTRLIAIYFRGEDEQKVLDFANYFSNQLKPYIHDGIKVAGPALAPIEKIKGKYRYLLSVRGTGLKNIREAIRYFLLKTPLPKGVEAYADVDAQTMM
jgi:primosomal protein N' (replication factor Y)